METGFKVLDAMTRMPVYISPTATVEDAAKVMLQGKVGSLLIMDGTQLAGIVTEGDFVRRVMARNILPSTIRVSEVMTREVITLTPDLDIYDAIVTMNNFDIRHAPVMHNGAVVGFLTQKDVLKIEPDLFDVIVDKMKIREESEKPIYSDIRMVE